MNEIKFAVVQMGYNVFGAGSTKDEAIADAQQWIESPEGQVGGLTIEQVEDLLETRPVDGGFMLMGVDHEEFDDYMKNQGGFEKRDGKWFSV